MPDKLFVRYIHLSQGKQELFKRSNKQKKYFHIVGHLTPLVSYLLLLRSHSPCCDILDPAELRPGPASMGK